MTHGFEVKAYNDGEVCQGAGVEMMIRAVELVLS